MDKGMERARLDKMTAGELAEELAAVWGGMTEEDYDDETIRAYLDALDEKAPMPDLPDAEEALARFKTILTGEETPHRRHPRLRYALHVIAAAAVLTALVLGGALAVQAMEYHRYGTVARWTEDSFSFGWIGSEAASFQPEDGNYQNALLELMEEGKLDSVGNREYTCLQSLLDDLGIRDVRAPALPEGYTLQSLGASARRQMGGYFCLSACYTDGAGGSITLWGKRYSPFYSSVISRSGDPVEVRSMGGVQVYVIPTHSGCAAAWVTGSYEWDVLASDRDTVLALVASMLEP